MGYSETLLFLLDMAIALSGYPRPDAAKLPPVIALSSAQLTQEVCPQDPRNCRGLAAAYDTEGNRVLYLDSLDIENDTDNSFIVHELVHFLQYQQRGDDIFATCRKTLATETEAYAVQNAYLKRRSQFFRAGEMLRFVSCPPEEASPKETSQKEASPRETSPRGAYNDARKGLRSVLPKFSSSLEYREDMRRLFSF